MPDPLKELASSNDDVNAKKKVKEQEIQITKLEREIASLKNKLSDNPESILVSTESPYVSRVWEVTMEAMLRQQFSVPGTINPNNVRTIESSVDKALRIAHMAKKRAEMHEKELEEEDKALEAAKANEALRNLVQTQP